MCLALVSCFPLNLIDGNIDNQPEEVKKEIIADGYSITYSNGNYYFVLGDIETYHDSYQNVLAAVEFDSIEEFYDVVTNGKLSDSQKTIIATAFQRDDTGILCCDFNNLYALKTPAEFDITGVSWEGIVYSYSLESKNGVFGYALLYNEEQYTQKYQSDFVNYFNKSTINITKTETIEGDKTATYYSTFAGEFKQIRYTLSDGDKTFVVDKTYRLAMANEAISVSPVAPSNVTLYCTEKGIHYVIDLFELANDPTDEWLMQFGMSRYVKNTDSIK